MRYSDLTGVLYHGDNYGTTMLNSAYMLYEKSSNQEGVGIYFSPNIDIAASYGRYISKINKNELNTIINSRTTVEDVVDKHDAIDFMYALNESPTFWYMVTDYGFEIESHDDVNIGIISDLYHMMKTSEIRNWQIELAEASGVDIFVSSWNKYIRIDGLYEEQSDFYAIINTDVKVTPVNF